MREEVNMIAGCLGMKLSCKARHLLPLKMLQNACDASFRVSGYDFNLVERLAFFLSDRAFDNSTARNEIGYEPATGLTEGLERTFAWYRDQGFVSA